MSLKITQSTRFKRDIKNWFINLRLMNYNLLVQEAIQKYLDKHIDI